MPCLFCVNFSGRNVRVAAIYQLYHGCYSCILSELSILKMSYLDDSRHPITYEEEGVVTVVGCVCYVCA